MFDELNARGLIKQTTNQTKLQDILDNGKVTFYIGFDPTADSLHVGHLLQLVFAQRMINAGHRPILLIGDATASIGDPTGKTDMRKMLSENNIEHNARCFEKQFKDIIKGDFIKRSNFHSFNGISFLKFIREAGPHFSVNNMLRAECFKSRMEHGLSFLEFNYMVMQSWDFLCLHDELKCELQVGGDDQWSNMLGGIELIRRKRNSETFALTLPLLLNANGQKMGKTEKGAVWLDANKTSVFDFWQFWRNVDDTEVKKLFKFLTFISVNDIDAIPMNNSDEINTAKQQLAFEITKIVHGENAANEASQKAIALFNKDTSGMVAQDLNDNTLLVDVVVQSGFAKSKTEARNLIQGKGISVNDKLISDFNAVMTKANFGSEIVVRKGKKSFCKFNIL